MPLEGPSAPSTFLSNFDFTLCLCSCFSFNFFLKKKTVSYLCWYFPRVHLGCHHILVSKHWHSHSCMGHLSCRQSTLLYLPQAQPLFLCWRHCLLLCCFWSHVFSANDFISSAFYYYVKVFSFFIQCIQCPMLDINDTWLKHIWRYHCQLLRELLLSALYVAK